MANHQSDLQSAQTLEDNQQRAKELTEKAASVADREERDSLIRRALDYELLAQTESRTIEISPRLDEGPGVFNPTESDGAAGEHATPTGHEISHGLHDENPGITEIDIEISAGDLVAGNSQLATPFSEEESITTAEEFAADDNPDIIEIDVEGSAADVVAEDEQLATPVSEEGSITVTEDSMEDEGGSEVAPQASVSIVASEAVEVTISTPEVDETAKPRRKPRKLQIKTKKKPRKLEIRSEKPLTH